MYKEYGISQVQWGRALHPGNSWPPPRYGDGDQRTLLPTSPEVNEACHPSLLQQGECLFSALTIQCDCVVTGYLPEKSTNALPLLTFSDGCYCYLQVLHP